MSDVVHINDSNFDVEVLQCLTPVLVDFGAVWCGPCQRQLPILEKYASDNGAVKVCSLDVDDATATAAKYGVKSVPTLLLFHKGLKVDSRVGLTSLASLDAFVLEKTATLIHSI